MTIPYPKPVTREMARANALYYADDASHSGRDRAKVWTALAALFPETEGTRDDEFATWTRHQIDKLSNIFAETMTRIDRLERSARQVNNDSEGWEGNLIQNEATSTEAMSDEDKEDLRLMRTGRLALVHPDFLMEARAALARMDLSVAEQETIRALRNHEAVVTPVPKSQRIAEGYGWISGPMQAETSPMDRAAYVRHAPACFSISTIDRVVEALRDEPTPE